MAVEIPMDWSEGAWKKMREDPVRRAFAERGLGVDLERVLELFPRPTGEATFDADVIQSNIERLHPVPPVQTGHPLLDLSVKTGLAFIDATFQGDHPKYGVKLYGRSFADAFPPTIIAAVDALTAWGLHERGAQLFSYWLRTFVRDDGSIDFSGPSIAEYGQLLHTAAVLKERAAKNLNDFWDVCFGALDRMAEYLLRLRAESEKDDGLVIGGPEDDERDKPGKYFHNNAWAAKGIARWADLCERLNASPSTSPGLARKITRTLAEDTLAAIRRTWPEDPDDWWLPPQIEPVERPESLTATRVASYTNYRYYPELLSSGLLPVDLANRIVASRLSAGGQFCGMTRFEDHLDDWPLADYLYGLWSLGRKDDFLLSLYGHVAYHQAEGDLTAFEQVSFPPGKEVMPYCLPCQLVAARVARLLVQE